MLRIILASAMVLLSPDGRSVQVLPPRLVMVKQEAELRRRCEVDIRIDGCTRFAAYELSARCWPGARGWSMTASARFRPYIFLRRRAVLTHEMVHIRDVETATRNHIQQLEDETFPTSAMCDDAAARAITDFPRRLERFIRASNEKHH